MQIPADKALFSAQSHPWTIPVWRQLTDIFWCGNIVTRCSTCRLTNPDLIMIQRSRASYSYTPIQHFRISWCLDTTTDLPLAQLVSSKYSNPRFETRRSHQWLRTHWRQSETHPLPLKTLARILIPTRKLVAKSTVSPSRSAYNYPCIEIEILYSRN